MSAKPIFIVGIPEKLSNNIEYIEFISEDLKDLKEDYHVCLVEQTESNDLTFKGFYPKDFDDDNFEEFIKRVKKIKVA